ncbi:MAG: phage tail tape measure protein [Treponema sp.]|nr:phage tail tape measure protein [Treponema sp.]
MNFVSSITLAFKDAFSSGFNDAKDSLAGMRGALDDINKNQSMNRLAADMAMMTSLTDPARQALSNMMGEPSRLAGRMDASMRNIQSLTGETNESLAKLEQELLAVGGASVAGPNAIADAYYNIASGIGDVTVRMDTLKAATALSESGQADLGAATSGLISVVNAYGTSAENITGLSDVFFQTVRKGVGSLDGFVSAMSSVAGLSASVGIGFDELGAAMAFVTAKGQTESVAATQLKAAMISFMKPTSEMAEALQSMGISSGSAMIQEYGLATSLDMLKQAFGGNQDAMAKALGSTEALQAAIALTAEDYTAFAKSYGEGLDGATAAGLEAQVLSYEAKVARLQSASDALSIGIGEDINSIKGFFVDIKYGFLTNVVSPLMGSPVGGAISKIAAFAGLGAKSLLDMGSGALNTATQLTVLTANISNAGGIAKLFTSTLGFMKSGFGMLLSPLKAVGTSVIGFIANLFGIGGASGAAAAGTGTFGATSAAASGGIGVATAATTGFAASLWAATWPILAVIAGIALVAGGVYLLVKNWSTVSAFFGRLWEGIKGAFTAAWDWIKGIIFGASDWVLGAVAIFMPIVGIPALIIKHWDAIKTFFVNLWNDPKAAVMGFIDWIGGKVEAITAPFKTVGGVFSKIGGFFKSIVGGGEESGTQLNDAFAGGIQSNASAPAAAFGNSLQGVGRQMPHSDAPEGPLSQITASGHALTDTFASGMDEAALHDKAARVFSTAMPHGEAALDFPSRDAPVSQGAGPQTIHIQNLYLQADDCGSLLDFVRMIMQSVHRPEEAPV